ncbi:MAG: hypothetical protein ISS45_08170 [Candidatus Omnitrophica bacterium]|nr:hypothetical protein [Candidatus Omnitrophota bacterium]
MNRILKFYLSTLVGLLVYCLTYMISTIYAVLFIGYYKILKNQEAVRFSFICIGVIISILVSIFVYRLIDKKVLKKENNT